MTDTKSAALQRFFTKNTPRNKVKLTDYNRKSGTKSGTYLLEEKHRCGDANSLKNNKVC